MHVARAQAMVALEPLHMDVELFSLRQFVFDEAVDDAITAKVVTAQQLRTTQFDAETRLLNAHWADERFAARRAASVRVHQLLPGERMVRGELGRVQGVGWEAGVVLSAGCKPCRGALVGILLVSVVVGTTFTDPQTEMSLCLSVPPGSWLEAGDSEL